MQQKGNGTPSALIHNIPRLQETTLEWGWGFLTYALCENNSPKDLSFPELLWRFVNNWVNLEIPCPAIWECFSEPECPGIQGERGILEYPTARQVAFSTSYSSCISLGLTYYLVLYHSIFFLFPPLASSPGWEGRPTLDMKHPRQQQAKESSVPCGPISHSHKSLGSCEAGGGWGSAEPQKLIRGLQTPGV